MKKWMFGFITCIVVITVYFLYIYKDTMNGKLQGEAEAIEIATKRADLVQITDTDYFYGYEEGASYKVVRGLDRDGEHWIVWVPEDEQGQVWIRKQNEGISKEDAVEIVTRERQPKQFVKVKLGAEQNGPMWEVTYIDKGNRYNFYYLTFEGGEFHALYSIQN